MRIAHLVAHDSLNGVSTSCKMLIDAQLAAGHEVFLISRNGSWLGRQSFKGRFRHEYSHFKTRPAEIRRVGYMLRDWRTEITHCHGSRANKYGLVYCLLRYPVVATAHARLLQLPWMFLSAIIAPSRETADYHLRHNRISPRKMHVISNLMSFDHLPDVSAEERGATRREWGASETTFVIGSVGSVCVRKNQIDALRVAKILAGRGVDFKFVLIGGIPDNEEPMPGWNAMISDRDIAPHVVLTGHRNDALKLMACLDALAVTSLLDEGPMVAMEAMATGIPVVGYRIGNMPAMIETGQSGWVLDKHDPAEMADILMTLINDRDLGHRVGAAGKARMAAMFNAETLLPQIEAVYNQLTAR